MWNYVNFVLKTIRQLVTPDDGFSGKRAVNYEVVIEPNKKPIEEELYLWVPSFVLQQIMNSPDDFNPKNFYDEKFSQRANRSHDAFCAVPPEQKGMCPMKVKHIRFSVNLYGTKNGQAICTIAHNYGYPTFLQSGREVTLIWVTSPAPIRKKKDLHCDPWRIDRFNSVLSSRY